MDTPMRHLAGQRKKKFSVILISVLSSLLLLSGCDSSSSSKPKADLRFIHASPDAPLVNIVANDKNAYEDLDYAQSTPFIQVRAGNNDLAVDAQVLGDLVRVIEAANFDSPKKTKITVIAGGLVADQSLAPIVVDNTAQDPGADEVAVQVVHASPAAPAVDVYVTADDTNINDVNANFSFAFQESVDAGNLPAATYRIRATLADTKTVVYDSGAVDLSSFAGSSLLLAAINTTNATQQASSPVQILVATDESSLVLPDQNTQVGLRVVHASPDANAAAGGGVEVFATSDALGPNPVELIDVFVYTDIVPGASSHVPVPAGEYVVDVAPDTDTIADSVFTSDPLGLDAGVEYTVVASGRLLSGPDFGLLVSVEAARSIATHTSVNVIHAAPAAGDVDVFVTAAGEYSTAEVEAGMAGDPLLNAFSFGTVTGFVNIAPGDYDIRVLAGGSTAINVEGFTLAAGGLTSVIARGPEEMSGTLADFGVLVVTN
ncbi:MAG: DUF4397 domain-containing protein [Oceanicoccus sp.]